MPPTATMLVGAVGHVAGVAEGEIAASDDPRAFFATTENVYTVPLESPVIMQEVPVVLQLPPPGDEVTI